MTKRRLAEGTQVKKIESIRDIGLVDAVLLVAAGRIRSTMVFRILQILLRDLKLKVDYGYYEDGWMDEHASLTVMAGEEGSLIWKSCIPAL